jgi:hypothetical protein
MQGGGGRPQRGVATRLGGVCLLMPGWHDRRPVHVVLTPWGRCHGCCSSINASSSPLTLKIMLMVALVFIPIVLICQTWVYDIFHHKLTDQYLEREEAC